jgi:hypothetical protein
MMTASIKSVLLVVVPSSVALHPPERRARDACLRMYLSEDLDVSSLAAFGLVGDLRDRHGEEVD